jgi:hypothetical protein
MREKVKQTHIEKTTFNYEGKNNNYCHCRQYGKIFHLMKKFASNEFDHTKTLFDCCSHLPKFMLDRVEHPPAVYMRASERTYSCSSRGVYMCAHPCWSRVGLVPVLRPQFADTVVVQAANVSHLHSSPPLRASFGNLNT